MVSDSIWEALLDEGRPMAANENLARRSAKENTGAAALLISLGATAEDNEEVLKLNTGNNLLEEYSSILTF